MQTSSPLDLGERRGALAQLAHQPGSLRQQHVDPGIGSPSARFPFERRLVSRLENTEAWGASLGVFVGRDLTPLKLAKLSERRHVVADRWECYQQWLAARLRFEESFGWPGGEMARKRGEQFLVGAPFDPADICPPAPSP